MLEIIKAIMKHCTLALLSSQADQHNHLGAIEYLCGIGLRTNKKGRDNAYQRYSEHCNMEPKVKQQYYQVYVKEEPKNIGTQASIELTHTQTETDKYNQREEESDGR